MHVYTINCIRSVNYFTNYIAQSAKKVNTRNKAGIFWIDAGLTIGQAYTTQCAVEIGGGTWTDQAL